MKGLKTNEDFKRLKNSYKWNTPDFKVIPVLDFHFSLFCYIHWKIVKRWYLKMGLSTQFLNSSLLPLPLGNNCPAGSGNCPSKPQSTRSYQEGAVQYKNVPKGKLSWGLSSQDFPNQQIFPMQSGQFDFTWILPKAATTLYIPHKWTLKPVPPPHFWNKTIATVEPLLSYTML